jgi:nucleoside-diphosphate-sugar epimerase
MQITITGGTGNVAEFVIKELEGRHSLVLFDRIKPGDNRFTYEITHPVVVGDMTSFADCERAVAGSQAIIHLGAIPWPVEHPVWRERIPGATTMPWDETFRVNTMGSYYLLEAARRAGATTVVAITSNCVLGHGFRISDRPFPLERLPIDESHPFDPEDSYSLSKLLTEETMAAYSRAYGMRCYALRPATVFRPDRMVEYARDYRPPTEWSEWMFGYNDVRDVARAVRLCLEAADSLPRYDAFYINAADTLVLEDSRAVVERLRPEWAPQAAGLSGRQAFINTAKAERAFGFRPEYSWTMYRDAGAGGGA